MSTREERRAALIKKFKEVGLERAERLSLGWVRLESEPGNAEVAAELLRDLHTLKGEAKTVGFADIGLVVHTLEALVLAAQACAFKVPRESSDQVLAGVDAVVAMLRRSPDQPMVELEGLLDRLNAATAALAEPGRRAPAPPRVKPASPQTPAVAPAAAAETEDAPAPRAAAVAVRPKDEVLRVRAERAAAISDVANELLVGQAKVAFALKKVIGSIDEIGRQLNGRDVPAAAVRDSVRSVGQQLADLEETSYRVGLEVQLLERSVRQLRLVPVSNVLMPFARVVRDLSMEQGKEVAFEVEAGELEADRRVLDMLEEPLLHLLRNAIDHGIEAPNVRTAAGKPRQGKIRIAVEPAGSSMKMSVQDDGAGVDVDLVKRKAVERGILSAKSAAALDVRAARELIFLPGFSTRDLATHVSGRGVGMDVVKRRVEEFGGRVELHGTTGAGLTTVITVPIALSLTRALVMSAGRFLVGVPSTVVENVRAVGPEARPVTTHEGPALHLGADVVPAVGLEQLLSGGGAPGATLPFAAVVRTGSERCALLIAEPGREVDVLIKPLGAPLQQLALVAGAASLDDGRLAMMLDPGVLLRSRRAQAKPSLVTPSASRRKRHKVLVVDDSVIFRGTISSLVEGLGHQVATADDGQHGLEMLRRYEPDVLVTDLQMPRMDGFALIKAVRAEPRWHGLPIVVVSSLGSKEDRRRAVEVGASAYLVKADLDESHIDEVLMRLLG